MQRFLDVSTSWATSIAQLGRGFRIGTPGPRPQQRLILYEFEGCPFCRRVRETISTLDLEVEVRPCPKGGTRFRPRVVTRGGKAQFPYLVDPNTGTEMYESAHIVAHLHKHYGTGPVPLSAAGPWVLPSLILAGVPRLRRGTWMVPSRAPEAPLELWGMEASPYTRIVREALCVLELPYILRTTPVGSKRWKDVKKRGGKGMVPFLVDPNTGTEMYESADIHDYLMRTYGTLAAP